MLPHYETLALSSLTCFLVCLFLIFIRLPGVCLAMKPSVCWVVQTRGGEDHYTEKKGSWNFKIIFLLWNKWIVLIIHSLVSIFFPGLTESCNSAIYPLLHNSLLLGALFSQAGYCKMSAHTVVLIPGHCYYISPNPETLIGICLLAFLWPQLFCWSSVLQFWWPIGQR